MPALFIIKGAKVDLSNIQPIHRKFESEEKAEIFLSKLSLQGGKTLDVKSIYRGGSFVHVWFMYDRTKLGYKKPEQDVTPKKVTKKKTSKKASKKRAK